MINNQEDHVLFIEPKSPPTEPLIDDLTRKMTEALRAAQIDARYLGWHTCSCGAHSDNCDHVLATGEITNSLAVHYLARHRSEVPQTELDKVAAFCLKGIDPTPEEIQ